MCSMQSNPVADECLQALSEKDRRIVEQRLANFAAEANQDHSGALDFAPLKRMPDDLIGIKKKRIGKHRAYYTGHHTDCSYTLFYVKLHKKDDVDEEDDLRFQTRLTRAIEARGRRELEQEQPSAERAEN